MPSRGLELTCPRWFSPAPRLAVIAAAALATVFTGPAAAAPYGPAAAAVTISDPAQYVNTFTGTKPGATDYGNGGGAGNTFPGATAPHGGVQWSPDTQTYQHGGYYYDDNRIRGFSLTHISGAGCGDYGNVPFMPVLGTSAVSYSTFSHANESASPGYYSVKFDNGLQAELSATQRSGVGRFTYPAGETASLVVDAAKAFNSASGSITIGTNTLTGYTDSGGFCGAGNRYRLYFSVAFDRSFSRSGVFNAAGAVDTARKTATGSSAGVAPQSPKTTAAQAGSGTRKAAPAQAHPQAAAAVSGARVLVSFDTSTNRSVVARVGVSFVSLANAQANVTAEQGSRDFDSIRTGTRGAWNDLLGRIAVGGGSSNATRMLYTALYHSLVHPSVFSDTNGQYIGFDRQVHTTAAGHVQYADYSGWDVYRSQVQLVALLEPAVASDIAQSAVNQGVQGGYFDRWTLANGGTGVMNGDPLPIIASSIYAFGGTNFDAATAVSRSVSGSHNGSERPGYGDYDSLGYVQSGASGVWGSAATTLEYTSADFAVASLAGRIGDTANYNAYLLRAQNWRNLFNTGNKYLQPRSSTSTWPSFSPSQQNEYVEGNGAQYTWLVPYDYRGLFDAMGGNSAVRTRLDDFFTKLNAGPADPHAYLGNEPTLETPWAYAYAGAPYRTQDIVRRALTSIFKPTPDGAVGNDDLGAMSSWAVWASLGMYPEAPGRAELILASPIFPSITITRTNGVTINITAANASDTTSYVQSLQVNGASTSRAWLPESFVSSGGTLAYTLGTSPNTSFGSATADAPPSFGTRGIDAGGRTGPVVGLASKCIDLDHNATANGTVIQLWDCNNTAAQLWTVGPGNTLQVFGKCLDVPNSATANGTFVQLYDCNDSAAQKWQPGANGSLVNPQSGRCLDVTGSNSANGTRLELWDCNAGANQNWRLP